MQTSGRIKKIAIWAGGVAMVLVVGIFLLIHTIRNTVRDAYAVEWVAGDIIQYMKSHDGAWPKGWTDLRPIHDRYVSEGKCPWEFEMFQQRVIVDWRADPVQLSTMPVVSDNDIPPFHVVNLRNGKSTHWQHHEPNQSIHKWLRENKDALTKTHSGRGR